MPPHRMSMTALASGWSLLDGRPVFTRPDGPLLEDLAPS
jgi:hypothetical protein